MLQRERELNFEIIDDDRLRFHKLPILPDKLLKYEDTDEPVILQQRKKWPFACR